MYILFAAIFYEIISMHTSYINRSNTCMACSYKIIFSCLSDVENIEETTRGNKNKEERNNKTKKN